MPVRIITTKEERLQCEKIESTAFVYSMDTQKVLQSLEKDDPSPDVCMGYFNDQDVMTACMVLPKFQIRYEDHWIPMTGVGGVASLPEYRFGGAIRQIFQTAFEKMRSDGTVFSALYPFSHKYYRKFGYETCQTTIEYEIPTEALSNFRYSGKVSMFQPEDSIQGFQSVFSAHFSRYHMAIQREDRHWKKILGENPYKERVYSYLLGEEQDPHAYVIIAAQDSDSYGKIAQVREMAFTSPKGFSDILGFLYRLSAQYKKIRVSLPDDIPLPAVIEESYDLHTNFGNQQMTRVIDVKKALELKPHFPGAAYTVQVQDDMIPENNGMFKVHCSQQTVVAEKIDSAVSADLTVDVGTFTQLLIGYLSLDEALFKKGIQVHKNYEVLSKIFTKRNVFLTDFF
ncbi:MAG: GNAT family N-acetyltransferase [Massiliimalia sp.]